MSPFTGTISSLGPFSMTDTPPVVPSAAKPATGSKPEMVSKPTPPPPASVLPAPAAPTPAPGAPTTFNGANTPMSAPPGPSVAGTPQPPPANNNILSWLNGATSGLNKMLPSQSSIMGAATESVPPLSFYTHHLGEARPVADSILKGVQQISRDPAQFGRLAGAFSPITRGALSTPLGLPGLLGLHGVLAGGQALADANTVFRPIIDRAAGKITTG